MKPCDCGAKKCGYADGGIGHSDWCASILNSKCGFKMDVILINGVPHLHTEIDGDECFEKLDI